MAVLPHFQKRHPFVVLLILALCVAALAQTETATISGTITDPSGAVLTDAQIKLTNVETGITATTKSNDAGLYIFYSVRPGHYRITVDKSGFRQMVLTDLTVNVQDTLSRNFAMRVGVVGESVTVTAEAAKINTESAAVGTVVDRQFVSNIPLNGRSFQTLIMMAPGVVMTPVAGDGGSQGQFSANGQRTNSNYFTVDGVSANFGVPNFQGLAQATSGSWAATNIQGSFSSVVSADALQEFKIQTSTFSPEFGRSPGAQISLVTRSGSNQFHGSVFEYLRNDVTDAKDWFDPKKPPLRFNDFGGTFGGPIWKNKTFFFFAYEGQRFLLPQPYTPSAVPSLDMRNAAPNQTARALLDAFPLPNGPVILDSTGSPTDGALFNVSYSEPNHSDSYSVRIDHNFNSHFSLWGRYNNAPSNSFSRNTSNFSMGTQMTQNTRTLTFGSTQLFTNKLVNEIRLNGSQQDSGSAFVFDGFGGGKKPDSSLFLPSGLSGPAYYLYYVYSVRNPGTGARAGFMDGTIAGNRGRSINFADNLSYIRGKHALKFGLDYRWYSPMTPGNSAIVGEYFLTKAQLYALTPYMQLVTHLSGMQLVNPNYSLYGQDTWNVNPRFTLTYGLRWEINPPPHTRGGPALLTLSAPPDLSNPDMTGLQLAPIGTPVYNTMYGKFAPRVGAAYQLGQSTGRELVLRAGWGMFYDLASTPFSGSSWPYTYSSFKLGRIDPQTSAWTIPFPVDPTTFNFPAPDFTPSSSHQASGINVAAKGFTMPRTYQWNFTLEQSLGRNQTVSVGYVGAQGRKLLRTLDLNFTDPASATAGAYYSTNFSSITYVDNASASDYHSLQVQFNRRLAHGLQAMANYTWSHSTDDSSSVNSTTAPAYIYAPSVNHGASDFDVRHNFTAAFTYEIPAPKWNKFAERVLGKWSFNGTVFARSGLPFNIVINESNPFGFYQSIRRPNLVAGVPIKVSDPSAPGGWRLNNALDGNGEPLAFTAPATDLAQGNMGRNSLYGFGAWQSDIGLHRTFSITERVKTEFRVEAFNIFNHPNFINPDTNVDYDPTTSPALTFYDTFGMSNYSMARGYGGGGNTGGFNPLFQVGGPRSMQFVLRVSF